MDVPLIPSGSLTTRWMKLNILVAFAFAFLDINSYKKIKDLIKKRG